MRLWRRVAVALLMRLATSLARVARLLGHAAVGVMTPAEMERRAGLGWDGFAPPVAGLLEWEKRLFAAGLRPGGTVLLIGCGAGRDLLELAAQGFEIDGIDIAEAALERARQAAAQRGIACRVERGSAVSFERPERYDAIVYSWFCYGYLPGRAARVASLARARRHLAAGGRVVHSVQRAGPPPRDRGVRLAGWLARVLGSGWRPAPGDALAWVLPGGGLSVQYEHTFTVEEIADEAGEAGLVVAWQEAGDVVATVLEPGPNSRV